MSKPNQRILHQVHYSKDRLPTCVGWILTGDRQNEASSTSHMLLPPTKNGTLRSKQLCSSYS